MSNAYSESLNSGQQVLDQSDLVPELDDHEISSELRCWPQVFQDSVVDASDRPVLLLVPCARDRTSSAPPS